MNKDRTYKFLESLFFHQVKDLRERKATFQQIERINEVLFEYAKKQTPKAQNGSKNDAQRRKKRWRFSL